MRIAIDARFYGPEGAGLGKYTEKLLEYLQKRDETNDYSILLRKTNFDLFKPQNPHFKKILADAKWYSLKEQVIIPQILKDLKPDVVHFLHYNIPLFWKGKFVVTIYDLTKLEFGKQASAIKNPAVFKLKQAFHNLVLRKAIKHSSAIISGSDSTKNKLLDRFGVKNSKITTIYAGADERFSGAPVSKPRADKILEKYKIKKPFIMYVGNAFLYKNLDMVLDALKFLKPNLNFVYVSPRNVLISRLERKAKELGVKKRFVSTGYVSNEDLSIIYKQSECYVFPSLSEGFGLPGLEAMASGCPLVCSDIDVFKEVYGDAALYFDPRQPKDLAKKISKVIDDKDLKTELVKKGRRQVKKYSWRKTAVETLKIYSSLL